MLRIANAELQAVDLDMYVPDFEDGAPVFVSRHEMSSGSQARATDQNICNTRICYPREAGFLAEVERNLTHVCLDLGEREGKFVVMFIRDGVIGAELHIVVRLDGNDVWEQITTLKRQVLDNEVKRIVRILHAWNRDVPNLDSI